MRIKESQNAESSMVCSSETAPLRALVAVSLHLLLCRLYPERRQPVRTQSSLGNRPRSE